MSNVKSMGHSKMLPFNKENIVRWVKKKFVFDYFKFTTLNFDGDDDDLDLSNTDMS